MIGNWSAASNQKFVAVGIVRYCESVGVSETAPTVFALIVNGAEPSNVDPDAAPALLLFIVSEFAITAPPLPCCHVVLQVYSV
jgi:hypothetical protein